MVVMVMEMVMVMVMVNKLGAVQSEAQAQQI
jgi:hypothetical protein